MLENMQPQSTMVSMSLYQGLFEWWERRLAAINPATCFIIAAGRRSHKELLTPDPKFNDINPPVLQKPGLKARLNASVFPWGFPEVLGLDRP
jgi:hypothetical protein